MALSQESNVYTISSSSDDEGLCVKKFFCGENISLHKKNTSKRLRSSLHTLSDSEESVKSLPICKYNSRSVSSIPTASGFSLSSFENHDVVKTESSDLYLSGIIQEDESPISYKMNDSLTEKSYELEKTKKRKAKVTKRQGADKANKVLLKSKEREAKQQAKALEKLKEREMKQQEKALAKALKDFEKESKRSEKSDECIKLMKVSIDESFKEESGIEYVFSTFADVQIPFSIEKNCVPLSVMWHHHIIEATVVDNQLKKTERYEMENVMLLHIPSNLFVDMVYATIQKRKNLAVLEQSLVEHITNIKTQFPHMEITITSIGLQDFLKQKKGSVRSDSEALPSIKSKRKNVSKKDIDEVLIEVQQQMFLNYRALENFSEFGSLLIKYTKAIAEAPLKKEKYHQLQQFSWYAQADSNCPVKIGKNGVGFTDLWQQQIQQFNLITKDIAQSIVAKYPSPSLLMEAYRKCESTKQAEKLLEDIIVRRDYGPLGSIRRVGPQLSYKMYRFFTSANANELLQR